jgi:hypothetical protein
MVSWRTTCYQRNKIIISKRKNILGLLIGGIGSASTATAAVALSQNIQNAHYVNTLTQNVSYAFQQQVAVDEKIDIRLNSLEAALLAMG